MYSWPDSDEAHNIAVERSKELVGKYFLLKVVDIHKTPVSDLCPELDYSSSALLMLYDWIGNSKPDINILSNLDFKKMCFRVDLISYDFNTLTKLANPFFEKKMYAAYKLKYDNDNIDKNIKCDIEIIGNDYSTNIKGINLWLDHPSYIFASECLDNVIVNSFTNYDYPEVWD